MGLMANAEPLMRLAVDDRTRVRAYALAMCEQVPRARKALEKAVDVANHARLDFEFACEQAELAAKVIASGDEAWISEVAERLKGVFG